MIWGAMPSNGTAGLFFLPIGTTMNCVRYSKMLEDKLKIHIAVHECNMFMHDGAPCHLSGLVSDFLKNKNIETLDWSGHSPDFNLVENLWATLKDKVADEHPINAKGLKMAIKRIWTQKIIAEYCKHLVHNMPFCLQAVINNKSGHTKC